MKNKRWFRLTGWLLSLVMILTVYPIVSFAETEQESNTLKPTGGLISRSAEVDVTEIANITFTNESGANTQPSAMDPNKTNRMNVTISGLGEKHEIGDDTQMVITLPQVSITRSGLESFSNETVSASLNDGKLVFSWKNGKRDSLEASFTVLPNVPAVKDLSGSYALVTKTGVMVGSTTWIDNGRHKLKSYKATVKNGKIEPASNERSIWTLKHVSGDYYTVYSQVHGKYLAIVSPNHVQLTEDNEETAQKFLLQNTDGDYYYFRYAELAMNNSGNNPANGFASYKWEKKDNEKFKLYASTDVLYSDKLLFDINGGSGDTAPELISAEPGTKVTLPGLNATKNGQEFIGWAEVKDFYSKVSGTNHTYHDLYKAGTSYTIKSGTTTLYAVYNPTTRLVQFGIRKDGIIQDEPNGYPVDAYCGHFKVDGILKEGHWVIDIDSTKPVNDYYVQNNVIAALNWVPSAEQIAEALKKEGNIDFNPETQYIHYYVLKDTSATVWKVDGVIRDKANVEITYDANVPGTEKAQITNMPGGYQVTPGTDVKIGADQGSTETKRPGRKGYYFRGWNTEKDGSGTYYNENRIVHMTQNLYLYAQWVSEEDELLEIKITSDWPAGKIGHVGDQIKLTAELTGFENKEYILKWQYSTDLENWTDVPNEHDITYTYTLDETTTHYTWRAVAEDIR
jgi:uncharacterized repeat protein (TIGR02543 family)